MSEYKGYVIFLAVAIVVFLLGMAAHGFIAAHSGLTQCPVIPGNSGENFVPNDRGCCGSTGAFAGRHYPTVKPCRIPAFPGTAERERAAREGKEWQFAQDGYMGPRYYSNEVP